jgi:FkbM family methyltransferase
MKLIKIINAPLERLGVQLVRFPEKELKRRKTLLNYHKVNKIFDIGASRGMYGAELRKIGYANMIISFEPLNDMFELLKKRSANDSNWKCEKMGLADFDGEAEINIANNKDSSSLLEMLPAHLDSAPESQYIGKQKIKIRRLDSIFNQYYNQNDVVFLKIDTQGFEKKVLEGASKVMDNIVGLQIEMSLIPLYKDSLTYNDMINYLDSFGFDLLGIEPGFHDKLTGKLLQFDGLFFKRNI